MATPKSGKTAPIILNEDQLEALAGMGCTLNEMAAFFKCSVDTLSRNYAESIEAGRLNGKASVRRMMWEQGKKGNSTALRYLIWNVLREKLEDPADKSSSSATSDAIMEKLSGISTEAILRLVKDHDDKVS